jgi:hypothetical protein
MSLPWIRGSNLTALSDQMKGKINMMIEDGGKENGVI